VYRDCSESHRAPTAVITIDSHASSFARRGGGAADCCQLGRNQEAVISALQTLIN
jgi:hypothetical protein